MRRPQWVSEARFTPDGWRLAGCGRDQGVYDAVVIAHNGKCANRLAAPMGVPAVAAQLRRLRLAATWVLMAAFRSPVAVPGGMEGAFIQGCQVLAWAGNNTAKLGPGGGRDGVECWTLISTQGYGGTNKVPQVRRRRCRGKGRACTPRGVEACGWSAGSRWAGEQQQAALV